MRTVNPARLVAMIERLLKFRYAQVCVHRVAGDLLDILERSGVPVSQELAAAVVNADDDTALTLLPTLSAVPEEVAL